MLTNCSDAFRLHLLWSAKNGMAVNDIALFLQERGSDGRRGPWGIAMGQKYYRNAPLRRYGFQNDSSGSEYRI